MQHLRPKFAPLRLALKFTRKAFVETENFFVIKQAYLWKFSFIRYLIDSSGKRKKYVNSLISVTPEAAQDATETRSVKMKVTSKEIDIAPTKKKFLKTKIRKRSY